MVVLEPERALFIVDTTEQHVVVLLLKLVLRFIIGSTIMLERLLFKLSEKRLGGLKGVKICLFTGLIKC